MIGRSRRGTALGVTLGLLSLGGAAYAGAMQVDRVMLIASRPIALAPIDAVLLPAGAPVIQASPALGAGERATLGRLLWRTPLSQPLVNMAYVEDARAGLDSPGAVVSADLLRRLGWRYTPAQQNLLIRSALEERFGDVVDRADGLLRRQRLHDQAFAMLAAMETLPQVQRLVLGKLWDSSNWRRDYLVRIGAESPAPLLAARARTMAALLRAPHPPTRQELAPTVNALAATGAGPAALALWSAANGRPADGNRVRDGDFRAAVAGLAENIPVAFEWQFGQGLGYSVGAGPGGVTVNWDGRGVPPFMSQMVVLTPGDSYRLDIAGRADSGDLRALLAPTLTCGDETVAFQAEGGGEGTLRFRTGPLPGGCGTAVLSINGNVDAGLRGTTFTIARVDLRPTG